MAYGPTLIDSMDDGETASLFSYNGSEWVLMAMGFWWRYMGGEYGKWTGLNVVGDVFNGWFF